MLERVSLPLLKGYQVIKHYQAANNNLKRKLYVVLNDPPRSIKDFL
jgi:hypothetical protein